MVIESRQAIYDYLYNLFESVSPNVYQIDVPQELTESDTTDGFIVLSLGQLNDESEFRHCTYGWIRCYVEAFIPTMSRGRVDYEKFSEFEDAINTVVSNEIANGSGTYTIQSGTELSSDDYETGNANNSFHTYIKSFVVVINAEE